MDLTPVDIVGKRCYHFIHAEDVEGIRHSHLDCKYPYREVAWAVAFVRLSLTSWGTVLTYPFHVSCLHLKQLSHSERKLY